MIDCTLEELKTIKIGQPTWEVYQKDGLPCIGQSVVIKKRTQPRISFTNTKKELEPRYVVQHLFNNGSVFVDRKKAIEQYKTALSDQKNRLLSVVNSIVALEETLEESFGEFSNQSITEGKVDNDWMAGFLYSLDNEENKRPSFNPKNMPEIEYEIGDTVFMSVVPSKHGDQEAPCEIIKDTISEIEVISCMNGDIILYYGISTRDGSSIHPSDLHKTKEGAFRSLDEKEKILLDRTKKLYNNIQYTDKT